MCKIPHSSSRRRYLKASTLAGLVAGVPAATLLDSGVAHAATKLCVRSPWVHYAMSGSVNDKVWDWGNLGLPPLTAATADSGQWTETPGWWRGDGVSRAMEVDWLSDEAGFGKVMLPGDNAYLLAVEINKPMHPNGSEVILRFGKAIKSGSSQVWSGLEMLVNIYGRAQVRLWDDIGRQAIVTLTQKKINQVNNGHVCLMVFIDHRALGSHTMGLYQYYPGTTMQAHVVADTSKLGPIYGGSNVASKRIIVGARRDPWGALTGYFNGAIKSFHVLNLGIKPPPNINDVMDGFSSSLMVPDDYMQGV